MSADMSGVQEQRLAARMGADAARAALEERVGGKCRAEARIFGSDDPLVCQRDEHGDPDHEMEVIERWDGPDSMRRARVIRVTWRETGATVADLLDGRSVEGVAPTAEYVAARVGRAVRCRVLGLDADVIGRLSSFDGQLLVVDSIPEGGFPARIPLAHLRALWVQG